MSHGLPDTPPVAQLRCLTGACAALPRRQVGFDEVSPLGQRQGAGQVPRFANHALDRRRWPKT
jgi:hypothetical protein